MAKYDVDDQPYIQSQYGASQALKSILNGFREKIDPDPDEELFRFNVMSLNTATGAGLDTLGKIIGADRTITIEDGSTVVLDDDNYRNYLKFKALANISDASIATLNSMSRVLYNDDSLIVVNVLTNGTLPNGDYYNQTPMRVRWTWRANDVSDIDRALFNQGIIGCLAAGVGFEVGVITKDPLFGFAGSGLQPFNQGAFGVIYQINQMGG